MLRLVAALVLSLSFVSSASAGAPKNIGNWQTDLQTAHGVAVAQQKPLLLVFGSDNCVFCRKLEKNTLAERSTAAIIDAGFIPVYLDYHKNPQPVKLLGIKGLPTSVVVSTNADLLGKGVGYMTPAKFQKFLGDAQKKAASVTQTSAAGK